MRNVQVTPVRMVAEHGSVHYGTFQSPFKEVNLLDAPLYAFPAPDFWKTFRLKEWQHFGIITPSHYFGMVIFDAKWMGASFFYAHDREKNTCLEHARQSAGRSAKVAAQVYDGACSFDARGYRLRFENKLDAGYHRILIDIAGDKKNPPVKGDLTVYEDLNKVEPLVQVSPITASRPLYTHKVAVGVSGGVRLGTEDITLDRGACLALLDEQKTYYPYFSFWKWSTAAGFSPDGKIMAFNLCQNMIADDDDHNENCFWIDGKIQCLKAARFEFDDVLKPWVIKTTDGSLDLTFMPRGKRAQKISVAAGLIQSDFHQPFGLYNGRFTDGKGDQHAIQDFFGLAEHHVTRY